MYLQESHGNMIGYAAGCKHDNGLAPKFIANEAPKDGQFVICDCYADHGQVAEVVGVSIAIKGESSLYVYGLYLAQRREDLRRISTRLAGVK